MANLFDSANYPTKEPTELVVGDRWAWKRTDLGADYPPSSYTLTYSLRLEGDGTAEIEITATASGSDYLVEVGADVTAVKTAGRYRWQAYITDSSDATKRATIDSGIVDLTPNREDSTDDPRSHARITLDAIETAIQSLAAGTVQSYSILGRSVTKKDMKELEGMRDKYRAEVAAEEREANGTGKTKLVFRL